MRKKKRICLLFLVCFLCCGCGVTPGSVVIGLNIERSGNLAQYGEACYKGVMMAVEQINREGGLSGRKLEVSVIDNRSQNSDAALAAVKFGSMKKISAVIGPTTSPGVKAAASARAKVPIITPSATADDLTGSDPDGQVFRICFTDTAQGTAMGQYAPLLGFKRAALLLDSSSAYAKGMSEVFAGVFAQNGGEIAATEYYSASELDFYMVLTKLREYGVDCIYLPAYYTEGALIIRQARELSIDAAILSGDAFDSPRLEDLAGDEKLDGIYFTNHYDPNSEEIQSFFEEYYEAYGEYPAAYAALGYDAVFFFAEAVKNAGSADREAVSKALSGITDFTGITGSVTINENRDAVKKVYLNQIQGGVRSAVDTSALSD